MAASTNDARRLIGRLREGSYALPSGQRVAYTDPDTMQELLSLYRIVPEQGPSGSSNLENDFVRAAITDIRNGQPLTPVQLGELRDLMAKYTTELAALRASPDRDGQNYSAVPDAATGRLIPAAAPRDHHGRFTGAARS